MSFSGYRREDLRALFWRVVRFIVSGGATTVVYAAIATVLTMVLAYPLWIGHSVAYAMCLPLSYWLQKNFTFQVLAAVRTARARFLFQSLVTYGVSTMIVTLSELIAVPRLVTIALVCFTVPAISFVAMQLWVFVEPRVAPAGEPAD